MEKGNIYLHLNVRKKWFDMIASEVKKDEYREKKPYWDRVFGNLAKGIKIKGSYYSPSRVIIRFSNGYAKDRDQMDVKLKSVRQGEGTPEWGAEPGVVYYVLKLGDVIALNQTALRKQIELNDV